MIVTTAPSPTLTAYERHILAALEDGCYLEFVGARLFLCDNRLNYRRLIADDTILDVLLTAALVREAGPGVWHSERMVRE